MEELQTIKPQILIDLQALESTPLVREPFEFVIVPRFVPTATLELVEKSWPDVGRSGGAPLNSVRLNQVMRALIDGFSADEFVDAISNKLGIALKGRRQVFTLFDRCRGPGQIHVDPPPNVATALFYPNIPSGSGSDSEACMRFTRGPDSIENFIAEIPPVGGALAAFRCRPNAWHGRATHFGRRLLLEICWQEINA
jgi:SM-20-related protein